MCNASRLISRGALSHAEARCKAARSARMAISIEHGNESAQDDGAAASCSASVGNMSS